MADLTPAEFAEIMRRSSKGTIIKTLNRFAIKKAARAESYAKREAGSVLNVRSGRLRASISAKAVSEGRSTVGILLQAGGRSKGVSYARIHEDGGEIKPKTSKFLTIPVHDSLTTGSGVARYASARDVPGLAFAQSRKGQPLLVHQVTGEVFYLLKKRIRIKKRPYMKPAIDRVQREIGRELKPLISSRVRHG
jgi:phage gpG-like protein|tara:strand:- start:79 stop:657 length:579 start_codon:yes stop_codon:yes gene_type:complete